ncbi:Parvulin-like peptidyl-prolyl isomerase [Marinitoga hydrogenitolerans DSM 16785]|uniref:Parvulin-like peptidyl-prolyl isomerase n=1 Tax=Marinitoga hydrogenitolerans (strain DSM 16785 / JCM 12826 / AT1271) TaxID=1122195 RepID=A0A1M4T2P4_MARH1|nr:peptidylprolyl isomerase [Marinitoga hydrogenitolerans]SHE38743.1 Parvulin-like peptidyl-prolyl isomerase [Marinitoga hydrogenitolerans DSM 16785]
MRDWFVKWEKVIVIIIVVLFTAGIIWWSIATYLGASKSAVNSASKPSRDNALAVITKDGTELDYPYWIMSYEVNDEVSRIRQQYTAYGQQIDSVFDEVPLSYNAVKQLFDIKVIEYYADKNGLIPTDKEVEKEFNKYIDDQIAKLKENEDTWKKYLDYYKSEDNLRDIIKSSYKDAYRIQLIIDRVKNKVSEISKEEGLDYIKKNFNDLKSQYEEVKAQHILVSDEATANKIKQMIESKEISFEDAAAKYSKDTSNATSGGELGWFKHNTMVKEFENASFNATVGDLVGPVKTDYGYHIIRVQDKKVFNKPEDIMDKFPEVYSEIEKKLKDDKFISWLKEYKESEKLGLNYLDENLKNYDEYTLLSTTKDEKKIKEFISYLESLVFDENGELAVNASTDEMALYINATNLLKGILEERLDKFTKYLTLKDTVDEEILNLRLDEINKKYDEISKKMKNVKGEEYTNLLKERFKYEDAKSFLELKDELKEYTDEEIAKGKVELQTVLDELKAKRIKVLDELFAEYPSSTKTIEFYYQEAPENPEVALKYSENKINTYKQYLQYIDVNSMFQYFGQQLREISFNLNRVAFSKASTETRIEALETLIDFNDLFSQDKFSKIGYLEEIKKLDPNYPGIDKMIEDAEKEYQESQNATMTNK